MVTFSVIIPYYRGNCYLAHLFDMVRENKNALIQKFPESEVELIIVNDSPEEDVLIPAEADSISFSLIKHSTNRGIHQARVTGLNECKGDYILFLDQDDEISGDFLVDQYKKMCNADVVIACAYLEKPDSSLIELYNTRGKKEKLLRIDTYIKSHNQIASPGQCLIRKEQIPNEWRQNILTQNGSDDLFLWILMFDKGCKFAINDRCLYTHKFTGENLSDSIFQMAKSSLEFVPYLETTSFVKKKHIKDLKKTIQYDMEASKAHGLQKVFFAIKYPSILTHKIIWKIKCL